MLTNLARVWNEGGTSAVLTKVKERLTGVARPHAYQDKTGNDITVRWNRFCKELPPEGGSLLDIGSNLGEFTARAAKAGYWSLGIEMDKYCVERAREQHATIPNCAFVASTVNIDVVRKLPSFDVILLLSVHHNWHSIYGSDVAKEIIRILVSKTKKVVIFEGPSRNERFYGHETPGFSDNDEFSVTSYYQEYLTSVLKDLDVNIKLLGSAPSVGKREPFRWIYAISK